ncbi:MAG TPA: hypothetical protein VE223_08100 [Nitrososphaeraceae archaeon]|nr:hypothetical protein [Nitrososphaeraceae archaeon]
MFVVKPSVTRVIFLSSSNKSSLSLFLGDDVCSGGVNISPIDLFERLAM